MILLCSRVALLFIIQNPVFALETCWFYWYLKCLMSHTSLVDWRLISYFYENRSHGKLKGMWTWKPFVNLCISCIHCKWTPYCINSVYMYWLHPELSLYVCLFACQLVGLFGMQKTKSNQNKHQTKTTSTIHRSLAVRVFSLCLYKAKARLPVQIWDGFRQMLNLKYKLLLSTEIFIYKNQMIPVKFLPLIKLQARSLKCLFWICNGSWTYIWLVHWPERNPRRIDRARSIQNKFHWILRSISNVMNEPTLKQLRVHRHANKIDVSFSWLRARQF